MQLKHFLVVCSVLIVLFHLPVSTAALPVLNLDRTTYTPFDKIGIALTDSSLNKDTEAIDVVQVSVSGPTRYEKITLYENDIDTGVFQKELRLTPDPSKYIGDIQARRDDGITISYRVDADSVITKTALIQYHEATISFDRSSYQIEDSGIVRVTDRDASFKPDVMDIVVVKIWSDTDTNGLKLELRELGTHSGIFEESLFFTSTDVTSGNRLRVSDGDSITVSFVDNTLPEPAKLSSNGIVTLETKTLVATASLGEDIPPTQRASFGEPTLLNSFGESVSQVFTGEQLLVQSEVTNKQSKRQPFTYIVQVSDSEGIVVSLSWVSSELPPNESLKVAQSWLPSDAGNYSIEIFLWESLTNPNAISPTIMKNIEVLQN